MSDVRIALVAEGPTDEVLIHAALRAILPRAFILTRLQPEATRPDMGTGWGGVVKWCHAAGLRHTGALDADPTLAGFDMLVIHVDADVALKHYADCGPAVTELAQQSGWQALPCHQPCPPVAPTCAQLQAALATWLGQATPGKKTVLCMPAQSIGTWLAAAVLASDHALLAHAECNAALENQLARLPLKQRVKKSVIDFRRHADTVHDNWEKVTQICSQAQAFEQAVRAV